MAPRASSSVSHCAGARVAFASLRVCFVTRLLRYCGFAGAIWLQRFLPRSMPSTTILMAPLLLVRGIRTGSLLVPLRGGGPSHKLHPPWVAAMTESEHDPGQ